jgi:hypothetical protein
MRRLRHRTSISPKESMKPLYSTYDYDAIMNNGVQANGEPKPETIIESIQEVDSRRGSVKVIWPCRLCEQCEGVRDSERRKS